YVTFSAQSAADAMNQLAGIMRSRGWSQQETLANGFRLRGRAPQQGLNCWLDCILTAEPNVLGVQFASQSGTSNVLHPITHIAPGAYQVHVGPCQMFVGMVGQSPSVSGTTVCGGIPYITPETGLDLTTVAEVWWAMGDAPAAGFSTVSRTPRSCLG